MGEGDDIRGPRLVTKITNLPPELLDHIVGELPRSDIKSLHLTNSVFRRATERKLFSTVVISKTKRDLASFLGIANNPRLAANVTRLVWYELTEDHNYLFRYPRSERVAGPSYVERVNYMLHDLIEDAFWTEPVLPDDYEGKYKPGYPDWTATKEALYLSRREIAQASVEQSIGEAVRKLVNLNTLVAQPMPTDRLLAVDDRGYRLDGNVLLNVTHIDAPHPPNGLFLFSRACLGDKLVRQIHSLYLSGPFTRPNVFERYYGASEDGLALFENLRTIDLCMHWLPEDKNNETMTAPPAAQPAQPAQPAQAELGDEGGAGEGAEGEGDDDEEPQQAAILADAEAQAGAPTPSAPRKQPATIAEGWAVPMSRCLRSAKKLQHLAICFETLPARMNKVGLLETVLFTETEDIVDKNGRKENNINDRRDGRDEYYSEDEPDDKERPIWPLLQSFHLTEGLYREKQIVHFVSRHAANLKHFSLMDCVGHTTLIAAELAAIRALKLLSFRVRSDTLYRGQRHRAREDYLVSERALLAFINKESEYNPVAKTKRKVFTTGPFIWDPQGWPAAAYFDLVSCTARNTGTRGELPGLGLPFDTDIDLAHQDEIQEYCSECVLGEEAPPRGVEYDGSYYATDSSEAEVELGMEGMQDEDGAWPARRETDAVAMPYCAKDMEWIADWAKQTTQEEDIDINLVTALPLGRSEPRWKAPYRQAVLLGDRAADIRHLERCRGQNPETSPRWCWARINSHHADSDVIHQEIYYWKTSVPGRGHSTTNWTFYKTCEDGTAMHGFGGDPLDFFSDWDSDIEGEVKMDSEEDFSDDDGQPEQEKGMYAEPSVYSRAFRLFLGNPHDMGDPMESGADIIRLKLREYAPTEAATDGDETSAPSFAPGVLEPTRMLPRGQDPPVRYSSDAVYNYVTKNMLMTGVAETPIVVKVSMCVSTRMPRTAGVMR